MKRAAFLIVATVAAAAPSDFDGRLANFHEHYNRFFRTYLGCPKAAASSDDCKPALGKLDYAEFARARRAARDLFDLQEKPQ